jgi:hypothetical protein
VKLDLCARRRSLARVDDVSTTCSRSAPHRQLVACGGRCAARHARPGGGSRGSPAACGSARSSSHARRQRSSASRAAACTPPLSRRSTARPFDLRPPSGVALGWLASPPAPHARRCRVQRRRPRRRQRPVPYGRRCARGAGRGRGLLHRVGSGLGLVIARLRLHRTARRRRRRARRASARRARGTQGGASLRCRCGARTRALPHCN